MYKVWTELEKEFIRQNAATMKDKELAKQLSIMSRRKVTIEAVRKQRQSMGLLKKPGRGLCGLAEKKED